MKHLRNQSNAVGTGFTFSYAPSPFGRQPEYNFNQANMFNFQTQEMLEKSITEDMVGSIYNTILVIPENAKLFGRLMFIVNNNQIAVRRDEVKEIIKRLANNSNNAVLEQVLREYNGEYLFGQLATSIANGAMKLSDYPIDWRSCSTPVSQTSFINTQPINQNQGDRINNAITKLKKLVEDHGFTNMDNAKKLKKFWDANFIPKYKEYADISFGDIWSALQ